MRQQNKLYRSSDLRSEYDEATYLYKKTYTKMDKKKIPTAMQVYTGCSMNIEWILSTMSFASEEILLSSKKGS